MQETTAYMGTRDYAGCIRESRRHPLSANLLSARATCAYFAGDRPVLAATCDEMRSRYPSSAHNSSCGNLLNSYDLQH